MQPSGGATPLSESYRDILHEQICERLTERLEATGLKAQRAANLAGLGPGAVRDILEGRTKNPRVDTLFALANTLKCDISYLIGVSAAEDGVGAPSGASRLSPGGTRRVAWVGHSEAGVFRENLERDMTKAMQLSRESVVTAPSAAHPGAAHFAITHRGDSMNRAEPTPIPDGAMCVLVDLEDAGLSVEHGRIYLVSRAVADGALHEWSLRRAHVFKDRIEFRSESSADYSPITVPRASDSADVKAIGLLTGMHVSF